MKLYFLKYVLWLYETHIQEDWDDYTRLGKICIYPFWVIRSLLVWLTFPLWIPAFQFTQSKTYHHYQKFGEAMSMEQQMEIMKQQKIARKQQTQNFLNRRKK